MHSASAELINILKQSHELWAQPRLIAEWNQNRYAGIAEVDNTPAEIDEGYDPDMFPISSIVLPNRPPKGILKSQIGTHPLVEDFSFLPTDARYYVADPEDKYKYWVSPAASSTNLGGGEYGFATGFEVAPYVIYDNLAWVNKIVIGFESTHCEPVGWTIETTVDGAVWDVVATDLTLDANGRAIIYYQDNDTWATTVNRDNVVQIKGIRVTVTTIDQLDRHVSLIEISPRLETDLSDYVMEYNSDFEMSETSLVTPLGKASSNGGNVSLSNIWSVTGGLFDNANTASLYYGIIDHNVKFTMELEYDKSKSGGAGLEAIRAFTLFTEAWNNQGSEEVSVVLKDYSKFMQETRPLPTYFENVTLGEIVWRLCDSVGFADWEYDVADLDQSTLMPYFWCNGEETLWEIFSDLAEVTQSAIYFDEYGVLRIQTRNFAYDLTKLSGDPDWEIDAVNVGSKLADLIEANQTYDFEANKVVVKYRTTKISDENNGFPKMETVWQAEDTVTLRASRLAADLGSSLGITYLTINAADSAVWPYEGIIQIEGELIKYKGKGYYYHHPTTGTKTHTWLYSNDEKIARDADSHVDLRWSNAFSGLLLIEERGLWNTPVAAHNVDISGYTGRYGSCVLNSGNSKLWSGGISHLKDQSAMRVQTNSTFTGNHIYTVSRGSHLDEGFAYIGTRMRLNSTTNGGAGLYFNGSSISSASDGGYYIDIIPTEKAELTRHYANEVTMYSRSPTQSNIIRIGGTNGAGAAMVVATGVWYDIDVYFTVEGNGDHKVNTYINGTLAVSSVLSSFRNGPTGRFGVFVRGNTSADFEYLYATKAPWLAAVEPDQTGYFDLIKGGYSSGMWDHEFVYQLRTAYYWHKTHKHYYTQKYEQRVFDEFGPIAHEVREFDVKFEKAPVVHSNLFMTNDSQIVCPEYSGDPFGASFILANASRSNAILSGEDTVTFGADNPVDQQAVIYGRLVFQEDEKEAIVTNDDAITRRGEVLVEIDSQWIQSEAAAKSIGEWIAARWGGGCDEMSVEIFGNPLIQIGDLVSLNYPAKSFAKATHKYFVVGVERRYDRGLQTSLTLRRAVV